MKRFLSIVLALMMVLMPTVWAAPAMMQYVESVTENAAEVDTAEETAVLSAAPITVKPGLNMLTGTTELLNAEGNGASIKDFTDVLEPSVGLYDASSFAIVKNPDDSKDNVYSFTHVKYNNETGTIYPGFRVDFEPEIEERPIYITFDANKVNGGEYSLTSDGWIMSDDAGKGVNTTYALATDSGWKRFDEVVDFSNFLDNDATWADDGQIGHIKIQYTTKKQNVTPTTIMMDDIGFYPTYKVTLMDATGSSVIATDYVLLDDEENFLTDYATEPKYTDDMCYLTWSSSIGGEAVEKVQLKNEDIVLYAKDSYKLFDMTTSLTYVTPKTPATVDISFYDDNAPLETIEWSIAGDVGAATLTDNGNGTATVSSKSGEGVVTVTALVAGLASKSVTLYVSDTNTTDDVKFVVIPASATITENLGKVIITANVFSKLQNTDLAVAFTNSNDAVARVFKNSDGTITVEAIKDGETNITVTAVCDNSKTATIAVSVSGQREKFLSYNIKYLAFGNSFLDHGPYDGWPWADGYSTNRGMAASRAELDYFNRTIYHLTHGQDYYATVEARKGENNGWESALVNYTKDNAYESSLAQCKPLIDLVKSYKPNLITVQLAENIRQMDPEILELCYDAFYGAIKEAAPEECIIVSITPFWTTADVRCNAVINAARKAGFLTTDMTDVPSYGSGRDNPFYAFEQYYDSPTVRAFGSHPGDWGHDQIALRNVEQINTKLSSEISPEYIYMPTAFEITGDDSVTETAEYTIATTPSDAVKNAVWSVDNENIATISRDGVLTPINNGTVKITAKSSYNDAVVGTKTVSVSGQTPCYTVTYAAGADDESIEGLPEAFIYAKDEYVLSTTYPTRNGYKFAGWALKENGTPVTSATITDNTTVYATWAFADSWYFENDGDYEGIKRFGLFNEKVENGMYTGISYESQDGMYIYNDALLINSKNYMTFRFEASMSTAGIGTKYDVVINTTNGDHTYTANVSTPDMTEFSFDISDLTGTITGFKITPVVYEAAINVEEIEFIRLPGEDILYVTEENTVVDADGERCFYGTIDIAEDASVILKNGIFHVDNFTGNTDAITTVDANLFTDVELPGYSVIDLGEKADEAYTRFIQVDGYTYAVRERENVLGLAYPEEKIVVIITKNGDTLIDSRYYCINDGTATAIDVFGNSLITTPGASVRTAENAGVRYRASITMDARAVEETYEVVEYGFIMARQDQLLKNKAQLNFDFGNIAYGAAYLKNDNSVVVKDKIFEIDDTDIFFTGVAINIPVKAYASVISARPYMKIRSANGVYTVYGEVVSRSIYQVARSVLADENNGLTDGEIEFLRNIVNSVQTDDETFVDMGGFFNHG